MLDPTKPLETRRLLRQRRQQREVLAFLDAALVRQTLIHPRYSEVDLTPALMPEVTERDRLILEGAVRERVDNLLQTPELVRLVSRIRRPTQPVDSNLTFVL